MFMKKLLITNLYPTLNNPQLGVFVKNFYSMDSVKLIKKGEGLKTLEYIKFYIKSVYNIFRYENVDIHFPTLSAPYLILFLFSKKNIHLYYHGSDIYCSSRWFSPILNIYKKFFVVVMSDFNVHFSSEDLLLSTQKYCNIIFPHSSVCNPSTDFSLFNKYKSNENRYYDYCYCSRFTKEKGALDLICFINNNLKRLSDKKILLIGSGPYFKDVIKLLRANDIFYDSYNFLPQDKLAYFFGRSNILLSPSHRESYGLTVREALSTGVTVYANHLSAFNDICSKKIIAFKYSA